MFINKLGLNNYSNKSGVFHTQNKKDCENNKTKFDFLGFTFSQRKVGKYKFVKLSHNKKTNIKPVVLFAKNKIKNHFKEIFSAIKKSSKALNLIRKVNSILRG